MFFLGGEETRNAVAVLLQENNVSDFQTTSTRRMIRKRRQRGHDKKLVPGQLPREARPQDCAVILMEQYVLRLYHYK
jgi:hypothetical protein